MCSRPLSLSVILQWTCKSESSSPDSKLLDSMSVKFVSQVLPCLTCKSTACQCDSKHLGMCPDALHSQQRDTGTCKGLLIMMKSGTFTCLCRLCREPSYFSAATQRSFRLSREQSGAGQQEITHANAPEKASDTDVHSSCLGSLGSWSTRSASDSRYLKGRRCMAQSYSAQRFQHSQWMVISWGKKKKKQF